jgi:uncharacterized protein (TIGR03067 family)
MMTKRAWIAMTLAALLVPIAGLHAGDDKEKDKVEAELKKLKGKWTSPSGNGGKVTYTFDGKKLKLVAPSRTYEMEVTLDPETKPEKTIDFKIVEGPEDAKGNTSKGIYKFDGEKFVFCFAPQGDRPTKFEMEGYEKILTTLTKDKD